MQSDVTTIISLLASTARGAATFWLAGIDLRCVFLFMKRGGITFEGVQSTFRKSLPGEFMAELIPALNTQTILEPGRRHFRWKTNFIILAVLNAGILASTYTSSILAGSVTWKADNLYKPGNSVTTPLGRPGDPVRATNSSTYLDSLVGYSTAIYSIFYGEAQNRYSTYMHRLIPDGVRSLPLNSSFDQLTVPYFAVDKFDWVKDPSSTLSSTLLSSMTDANATGPRVMTVRRWGLVPNGNWGPSEDTFSEPQTVSESRLLVMSGRPNTSDSSKCNLGPLTWTIPSDVHPYTAPFKGILSCFIFANVAYQAGAARSPRCRMSGPGALQDVGNVKDLQLVEDPVTSVALSFAPYVSTTLFDVGIALPFGSNKFSTMEDLSIELLSRSYQVAWNTFVMYYGLSNPQSSNVQIAVEASIASVKMWRVAVWAALHALLVTFGFAFRHLHTRGRYPWIEDPVTAALLVDPTTLMNDPRTWAGKEPPHIGGTLKLEQNGTSTYLVLEEPINEEKIV